MKSYTVAIVACVPSPQMKVDNDRKEELKSKAVQRQVEQMKKKMATKLEL